ncbi:MAG: hypothetical protein HUU55_06035 [Myxococcales bacterium]|nr:hypothetical protein [Myxococcales bacterium]
MLRLGRVISARAPSAFSEVCVTGTVVLLCGLGSCSQTDVGTVAGESGGIAAPDVLVDTNGSDMVDSGSVFDIAEGVFDITEDVPLVRVDGVSTDDVLPAVPGYDDIGSLPCPDTDQWPVWPEPTPDLVLLSEQYCKTIRRCEPTAQDVCLPILLSLAPVGDPAVFAAWINCQLNTMPCPGTTLSAECLLDSAGRPVDAAKLAVCDDLARSMDQCLFTGGDRDLAYVQCLQIALSQESMCATTMCTAIDVTPGGSPFPLPPPPSAACAKLELCLTFVLNLANNPAWGSTR